MQGIFFFGIGDIQHIIVQPIAVLIEEKQIFVKGSTEYQVYYIRIEKHMVNDFTMYIKRIVAITIGPRWF